MQVLKLARAQFDLTHPDAVPRWASEDLDPQQRERDRAGAGKDLGPDHVVCKDQVAAGRIGSELLSCEWRDHLVQPASAQRNRDVHDQCTGKFRVPWIGDLGTPLGRQDQQAR